MVGDGGDIVVTTLILRLLQYILYLYFHSYDLSPTMSSRLDH